MCATLDEYSQGLTAAATALWGVGSVNLGYWHPVALRDYRDIPGLTDSHSLDKFHTHRSKPFAAIFFENSCFMMRQKLITTTDIAIELGTLAQCQTPETGPWALAKIPPRIMSR